MGPWHSLSGLLYSKPTGPFSRFKSKRAHYYVFEESSCRLQFYRDQREALQRDSQPLGCINIKGAAITLRVDEPNSFGILSEGKEFVLQAENHESMMIWVMALQANRDAYFTKEMRPEGLGATASSKQLALQAQKRRESAPDASFGYGRRNFASFGGADRRVSRISILDASALMTRSAIEEEDDGYLGNVTRKLSDSLSNRFGLSMSQSFSVSLTKASPQHSDQGSEIGTDFNYDSLLEESPSKSRQQQQQTKPTKRYSVSTPAGAGGSPQLQACFTTSGRDSAQESRDRSGSSCRSEASSCGGASASVFAVIKSDAGDSDIRHEMEDLQKQNSALKEVLRKRDTLIAELDLKLSRALRFNVTRAGPPRFKSESAMLDWIKEKSDNLRHLEEQCRVLQNNNRFVNSEVRRITSLRHMEQEKFRNQDKLFREHKLQLENWKRDYLFLLQSCITVPTGDVSDGIELNLYGGGRHKERLRELLEEARVVNPRLPTFESLVSPDGHVDSYGFRHSQESESMQLHYISRQLHEHYATTLDRYDEHQRHWKSFIASNRSFTKTTELKSLIRGGIPRMYRSAVWRELIHAQVQEIRSVRGQQYYSGLVQRATESDIVAKHRKQISLDLMRTMPGNVRFESSDSEGIQKLQEILQAFCLHNPSVGYCQGMNFIAGMGLLFLSKEDAFWLLVAVTECYFHPLYFTGSLLGAQADQLVLKDLIRRQMPNLHEHISNLDIDVGTVTLNWFLAIYFDALPFETLLRLWDCFLLEGPKVLFRFALAVLKSSEAALLRQTDTIGLWRHLKAAARLAFDVDGLARTAFAAGADAGVPSRRELDARRGVYIAALAEADERRKRLRRRALQDEEEEAEEDEAAVDRGDMESPNQPLVSSGLSSPDGSVWICYGDSGRSQVCRLRIEDNLMFSLGVEIESQVSCSYSLDSCQVVLLGTLGMFIAALDAGSGEQLWEFRMPDSVLAICSEAQPSTAPIGGPRRHRVFAALASGSLAVLEDIGREQPDSSVFFINLGGACPATAVALAQLPENGGGVLWVACGNFVQLLRSDSLDAYCRVRVSECPFDSVLCLHDGGRSGGVWLAVRGSPVVELWSSDGSSCRLRFDIQTMTRPLQRLSEFDSDAAESTGQAGSANPFRVTSLLATGTRRRSGRRQLWVGTGSGDLIVFDVRNLNDGEDGFELDEEAGGSSSGSETDSEVFDTGGRAAARTPPSTPTVASLATVAEEEDKNEEERNSADQGGGRVAYSRDLELVVRNKVAESAIVCLIPARLDSPSGCIVSCSRRFGEDEAVLKWRPENSEQQIWTNEPVFEVNPVTRTIQLPTYMVVRNRIGSDRSIKEGRSVNRNDRSPKLSS